jgi:hypothetical protein
VAQALLQITPDELTKLRAPLFNTLDKIAEKAKAAGRPTISPTWKNAIKHTCPITGKPMHEVLIRLEEAGLSREDMAHLEYLENPAILQLSGIKMVPLMRKVSRPKTIQVKNNTLSRLFGGPLMINQQTTETVEEPTGKQWYPDGYYRDRKNLEAYLRAWIGILEDTAKANEGKHEELHRQLLVAVAEENFEKAAQLRDALVTA